MFYGRLSREEGRWITICPSPSSLINSHISRPDYKFEELHRSPNEKSDAPIEELDKIRQDN
jgi:hypothetical protein